MKSLLIEGEYKINEIYESDIFYLMEVLADEQEESVEQSSLIGAFKK